MKAYMSNPHPGFVIPDRHDMPAERQGLSGPMALDEARAILAETEPSPYNFIASDPGRGIWTAHVWDHYPHGHGSKETRFALAESLAAFLED
jgi:hypothetical protein